jgi:phage terminase large subunit-like protein
MRRPSPVTRDQMRRLALQPPEVRRRLLGLMSPADLLLLDADFETWRHDNQMPPSGEGWRTWLMTAGRGFGKTRAGAEWITRLAVQRRRPVRIAVVGATEDEARQVMIEGEDGLLAVARRYRIAVEWEPSLKRLTWPGGSVACIFSGENPDGLRGPQHHYAWCDELAKWARPEATWDNLQMTLRAGERPRALVTTTPRPIPLLKRLLAERWTVTTRGRTDDNIVLEDEVVEILAATYGGTRLGRQELEGELIEEVEGSLWPSGLIEGSRHREALSREHFRRVVIGVDPPASAQGTCGIVACGLGADGTGYVLGDHSQAGLSPEGWARRVVAAAEAWGAERVVVEVNQGGEMVASMLRGVDPALPVRSVHARYGKSARAEPVAMQFEMGRAKFAGIFPELEKELAGMIVGGRYEGPGSSPDRADAMVWAMTELLCGRPRAEPRIRML